MRACEIDADCILIGKKGTDGVYNKDPNRYADAVKYDELKYDEVLQKRLAVMDSTATSLAMENQMPIVVFGIDEPENMVRVAKGEKIGTIIT